MLKLLFLVLPLGLDTFGFGGGPMFSSPRMPGSHRARGTETPPGRSLRRLRDGATFPGAMVTLEVQGRVLRVSPEQIERARRLADAEAGRSSSLRDLALVLDLALTGRRVIVLRRSEARELLRLADEDPLLAELAALLRATGDAAAA